MNDQLQLYNISMKYIRDLSNVDDNVLSVSPQTGKQDRPFIGILIMINGKQYCAPITSPKPKHKTMPKNFDYLKIMGKVGNKEDIIGVINFNNMIPIHPSVIYPINLKITSNDTDKIKKYKTLMGNQLKWCRSHSDLIEKNSQKTYNMIINGKGSRNLVHRCCDFKKLEDVLDKRLMKMGLTNSSHSEKPNASDDLAQKEAAVKKCDEILKANPDLKAKLNAAAIEYSKKYNVALLDSSASAEERYEMRNKILKENPELKEEYVKAKNEYEQRQLVPTDSKQTKSFAQGLDEFAKRQKGQSSPKLPVYNSSAHKHRK